MTRYITALISILFTLSASHVMAQSACFERDTLLKHLNDKFQEAPVSAGLAANGSVLEILTSPDGTTWTITLTVPNGATCVMASGESWTTISRPPVGKGS
ncbi:MAG: hypothetical protein V7745_07640 [Pseudomonadales bacterium]